METEKVLPSPDDLQSDDWRVPYIIVAKELRKKYKEGDSLVDEIVKLIESQNGVLTVPDLADKSMEGDSEEVWQMLVEEKIVKRLDDKRYVWAPKPAEDVLFSPESL